MKKLLSLILAVTLVFILSAPTFVANNDYTDDSLDFHYPITPEMDEWKSFQSLDEMIEACQIPDEILSQLSTDKLIDVVLDYPLAVNLFAYDTPEEGIRHLLSYFNGLQELARRSNAAERMDARLKLLVQEKTPNTVKKFFAEAVLGMLSNQPVNNAIVHDLQRYEIHYNYTPNGTRVSFIYNLSWADHGYTESEAHEINEQFKASFVNATPLRDENPAYNCHSYAWYSTSSGNLYWLNQGGASLYKESYTETTTPRSGDKVWYGPADHSAIYYRNSMVTSKWGVLGLFRHDISYCPYSSSNVSYWRLD